MELKSGGGVEKCRNEPHKKALRSMDLTPTLGSCMKAPSRSPSPCPPTTTTATTSTTSWRGHGQGQGHWQGQCVLGVAGGGTSTMSRRRSPLPMRREVQQGGGPGGDSSATQPLSAQGSEEDATATVTAAVAAAAAAAAATTLDEEEIASSSILSNGSLEHVSGCGRLESDEADGSTEGTRTRNAMEHMQLKIARTKELIKSEQTARDDNVNEYLKLASNADKQQLQRIKAVFEKKNQKSAQSISQLQKKLDSYQKRLRDLELNGAGSSHRQPREMLRDMSQGLKNVGGNIRDGITGFSGGVVENIKGGLHGAAETVMAKPREFAHLIKNKFGSADNINILSRNGENGGSEDDRTHHGSATLPGGCSLTCGSSSGAGGGVGSGTHTSGHGSGTGGVTTGIKLTSDEGSECSSVTSESLPHSGHPPSSHRHMSPSSVSLDTILAELRERQDDMDRLRRKFDDTKDVLHREIVELTHSLQEERFRCERLEEQINDLTELHQNEVENLKQTITDMEEKVQYQSEERLRDIHDMLESCQTKISKMEHQQLQHQQYVTLEGIDNSNARALAVKLINVVLTVLQVVLLLVATAAGILMPFLRTRLRVLTTTLLIGGVVFVLKQWPEVHDVGSHVIRKLKEALTLQ